jgi:hypothetical protein
MFLFVVAVITSLLEPLLIYFFFVGGYNLGDLQLTMR